MSHVTANLLPAQVIMKPDCVLGLATGSTPVGAYKQLVQWFQKGDLDFSEVTSVNLDEYKGLSPENDQSYRYFMNTNLFDHVNIDKSRTFVPNGLEPDSETACCDQLQDTQTGISQIKTIHAQFSQKNRENNCCSFAFHGHNLLSSHVVPVCHWNSIIII